ncbi:hypothetical protein BC835DRAFT_333035 [Cytidiella melzeri]|nr:hypothetical protein BC835DRAFT_333035 [Cytidiella melzeri]
MMNSRLAQDNVRVTTSPSQRRPRNWEALQALETLSAPSSPSQSCGSICLASLASSGEIPIMLDSGIILDDEFMSCGPSRLSSVSSSAISTSAATTGTFGIPRTLHTRNIPALSINSQLSEDSVNSSLVAFGYKTSTNQSSQFLTPQPEGSYNDKTPGHHSRVTLSAYMAQSVSQKSLSCSTAGRLQPSSSQSSWTSQETTNRLRVFAPRSPSLASSLSTITLAAASAPASPTLASSLGTEAQAYASRYRRNNTSSDHRSFALELSPAGAPSDDRSSLKSPVHATFSRPSSPAPPLVVDQEAVIIREGPRLRTKSAATSKSSESGRSTRTLANQALRLSQPICLADSTPEVVRPVQGLPGILGWLENIRFQLWIDQEGFRLVRPTFELFAYASASSQDGDLELDSSLMYGSVEFRPVERQTFAFHHAALDPAPTLRKLTMSSDDTRDYISRQAILTIKTNGIYSVSGSETLEPGPTNLHGSATAQQLETLRLHWRFEYMVDDHYSEATGKLRPGEKALVPLLFSCSPGLLHPTHGKKIKLMHVFKKGLAPKLASAKIKEVPAVTSPLDNYTAQVMLPNTGHRRAHSSVEKLDDGEMERWRIQTDPAGDGHRTPLNRNRAVSFSPGLQLKVDAALLDRHILPPALVDKLMNHPEVTIMDELQYNRC